MIHNTTGIDIGQRFESKSLLVSRVPVFHASHSPFKRLGDVAVMHWPRLNLSPSLSSNKDHDIIKHVFDATAAQAGPAKFADKFQN